jgi:hypothetical protein
MHLITLTSLLSVCAFAAPKVKTKSAYPQPSKTVQTWIDAADKKLSSLYPPTDFPAPTVGFMKTSIAAARTGLWSQLAIAKHAMNRVAAEGRSSLQINTATQYMPMSDHDRDALFTRLDDGDNDGARAIFTRAYNQAHRFFDEAIQAGDRAVAGKR